MRSVVLIMTASMDGFVVAPTGHAGGLPEPAELQRWKLDRIRRAGAHIMGRVTYEEMASAWPHSTEDYATPMNEIPKVVFSKTLEVAPWPESSIASGELA
jgi:dihydrofolate reductase